MFVVSLVVLLILLLMILCKCTKKKGDYTSFGYKYFCLHQFALCADNTTANSAQEETSFTCNDNDDDDCLRGVVNYETKFAGRKGKAILNEGETDCGER